jgi:hypothetical protein
MATWNLRKKDLKKYPHFDCVISAAEAQALATNPSRVITHAFYPFIRYYQRWTRFAKDGSAGKSKERPIRYAARRDAAIYSYYRHILSERYEVKLARLGLESSVLAYRRIICTSGQGKCNIHFAREAITKIRELGDCCVIALDISSFFESLDHQRLKAMWCRMLGVTRLPADHFQVFEAITRYSVVDKLELYERLGHFGPNRKSASGKIVPGYLAPYKEVPRHLCMGKEFREKIAGGNGQKSIIKKNDQPHGIPQGSPISDLLANLYLLDFDQIVAGWVREAAGAYYRYSDDILIIVPGEETTGRTLMTEARELIGRFGCQLVIKDEKSSVFVFKQSGDRQICSLVHGTQGKNGLEYLGFRYDGRRVYLRDATLGNLKRKVAGVAKHQAAACARRYPDKNADELKKLFNYEQLIKRFGKVERFAELEHDYHNWTFWTYATRAVEILGPHGKSILRQLRNHRRSIRYRADKSLEKAVKRREKRKLYRHRKSASIGT